MECQPDAKIQLYDIQSNYDRGGVSLRISSKIYPRCLFSLTPNVIGRYRNFNCSMVSFRSR
ncbi:hypothetical protein T05_3129 [Trichinella murrelli]|uniref:Uncharacterized protein n=1 Tax=Trichinella murrelli TaxID=144512 RepID=A0A0V0TP14_9BILA|nr:hypothetical protein T05_3129 [Trichinella murrelli]